MEYRDMTAADLEARKAEIRTLVDAEDADLDALESEARAINEEIERRMTEEAQKAEIRKAVAESTVETIVVEANPIEEERHEMTLNEIRSSREYGEAFLRSIQTGDRKEVRSLLTTQVSGGYIPVPTDLETEIKTAWEEHELMGLVKHSSFTGNVKIGFELTATGATVHTEGADAPDEEVVTLGAVTIENKVIKKWITVSDEALQGTTVDTAGYLYKEIAHKIVEKAEETLVGKIIAAPATASATACAVPVYTAATLAVDTVTMALAELSGQAKNVVLAMNRRTYAALKGTAKKNNYGVDPFDGCKVVFSDAIKAFSAATTGEVYIIAGDFGYGCQANFPNGTGVEILNDPYTYAESDLVKLVGKQYVGMAVVANNALVKIKK